MKKKMKKNYNKKKEGLKIGKKKNVLYKYTNIF
jgi:hypothetical protein